MYVPEKHSLGAEAGGLRPTSMARLELARADGRLRSVNDFVPRIDRGSNRDHQRLVAMVIGHEMRLRNAARSEQRAVLAGDFGPDRTGASPGWIQAARAVRADAIQRAGLGEDLAIANRYLGEASSAAALVVSTGVPEPNGRSVFVRWASGSHSSGFYREWTVHLRRSRSSPRPSAWTGTAIQPGELNDHCARGPDVDRPPDRGLTTERLNPWNGPFHCAWTGRFCGRAAHALARRRWPSRARGNGEWEALREGRLAPGRASR